MQLPKQPTLLVTSKIACKKDAKDVLQEAIGREFESVIVVGIRSDGTITLKKSMVIDSVKMLGLLELAKQFVYEGFTDG